MEAANKQEAALEIAGPQRLGECTRCGRSAQSFGAKLWLPWCLDCSRKNAAEWRAVYGAWAREHGSEVLRLAGAPARFQPCTLANFQARIPEQRRVIDAVTAWARNGEERGLYLHGPVGTGKTHLAAAALLELLARRWSGIFVSANELLLRCRESWRGGGETLSGILEQCTGGRVLALDDLAAEKTTDFSRETLLTLVDRAYADTSPLLIVTSNLDLPALGKRLDLRIADRIGEMCLVVKIGGPSFRRQLTARQERARNSMASSEPLEE